MLRFLRSIRYWKRDEVNLLWSRKTLLLYQIDFTYMPNRKINMALNIYIVVLMYSVKKADMIIILWCHKDKKKRLQQKYLKRYWIEWAFRRLYIQIRDQSLKILHCNSYWINLVLKHVCIRNICRIIDKISKIRMMRCMTLHNTHNFPRIMCQE